MINGSRYENRLRDPYFFIVLYLGRYFFESCLRLCIFVRILCRIIDVPRLTCHFLENSTVPPLLLSSRTPLFWVSYVSLVGPLFPTFLQGPSPLPEGVSVFPLFLVPSKTLEDSTRLSNLVWYIFSHWIGTELKEVTVLLSWIGFPDTSPTLYHSVPYVNPITDRIPWSVTTVNCSGLQLVTVYRSGSSKSHESDMSHDRYRSFPPRMCIVRDLDKLVIYSPLVKKNHLTTIIRKSPLDTWELQTLYDTYVVCSSQKTRFSQI